MARIVITLDVHEDPARIDPHDIGQDLVGGAGEWLDCEFISAEWESDDLRTWTRPASGDLRTWTHPTDDD